MDTHGKKRTHRYTTSRGFTFIEMLVAVSILVLSVVGPMYLASQGLRAARIARDQINANYLVQEAVEYIRYRRDTNMLKNQDWMTGLQLCFNQACMIDIFGPPDIPIESITPCDGVCDPIRFHEDTGKYGGYGESEETGWVATKFTRTITIDGVQDDQEIAVSVTVSWQDGLINRTYTVTEHLFNWQ